MLKALDICVCSLVLAESLHGISFSFRLEQAKM